jgi:hypothetical protein
MQAKGINRLDSRADAGHHLKLVEAQRARHGCPHEGLVFDNEH